MTGEGERARERDEALMRRAIEAARKGVREGQTPFGACLARGGDPVAVEHNVVWATTDVTAHAEVHALRRACRELDSVDLSGCTMYATCEPCPMCLAACHWARLDRVVYGARIEDARDAGFRELSLSAREMTERGGSDLALTGGVLREACVALFGEWRERPDRRAY